MPAARRPARKSAPPTAQLAGEPFSLIFYLRSLRRGITVAELAPLIPCAPKTLYKAIKDGKIPVINIGFDLIVIDVAGWLRILEHDNPHLAPRRHARAA